MKPPEILVVSREVAGDILSSARRRYGIKWVISLGAFANSEPPKGWDKVSPKHKLRLEFDDVTHTWGWYVPASRKDIVALIAFCKKAMEGRVLIHCAQGVSRSTAAALVLIAIRLGPGHEKEAVEELFRVTDEAQQQDLRDDPIHPNRRMVWMADQELARGGFLFKAFADGFSDVYTTEYEHRA